MITEEGVGYRLVSPEDVGLAVSYACELTDCVELCSFANLGGTTCVGVNFRVDNTESSEGGRDVFASHSALRFIGFGL